MFFNSFILTKKGPLAKIWLAAHWEKKLTKSEIQLVSLNEAVVSIIQPQVPISCRTSGELLLGCVRIYANKVSALLKESQEATLLVSKTGLKARMIDLDGERFEDQVAEKDKITLPGGIEEETIMPGDKVDFGIGDIDKLLGDGASRKQSEKDAQAMIDDEWFQAETSQALMEIQASQPSLNLTQEALRELAGTPRGALPARSPLRAGSEHSDGRSSGLHGRAQQPPDPAAELDVGQPITEEVEEQLERLLREGGGAPVDDAAGRPSVDDVPAITPAGVTEEGEVALYQTEEMAVREPKRKRIKIMKTKDDATVLTKEHMQRNQSSEHQRQLLTKDGHRYPIWELGPQARREHIRTIVQKLHDAPLQWRGNAEFGLNRPMVCLEIDVGDDEEAAEGRMGILHDCIEQQLNAAAQKLEAARAEMEQGRLEDVPMSHVYPEPEWPDQHLDQDFMPMPGQPGTPQTRSSRMKESVFDPVVSAQHTLDDLKGRMGGRGRGQDAVDFASLTAGCGRRAAARRFMDLLVLGSKGHVSLEQFEPYGPITVRKAAEFNAEVIPDEAAPTQAGTQATQTTQAL